MTTIDHNYARRKLQVLLRDLKDYNADELWREMSRIAGGATGRCGAEDLEDQLDTMVKRSRQQADRLAVLQSQRDRLHHYLTQAHKFTEHAKCWGKDAGAGILRAGNDTTTDWDVDASKAALAECAPSALDNKDASQRHHTCHPGVDRFIVSCPQSQAPSQTPADDRQQPILIAIHRGLIQAGIPTDRIDEVCAAIQSALYRAGKYGQVEAQRDALRAKLAETLDLCKSAAKARQGSLAERILAIVQSAEPAIGIQPADSVDLGHS